MKAGQFAPFHTTAFYRKRGKALTVLHLGPSMLRELGLPRYGSHVLYDGHNAIPHSNVTILREVNSYSIPPQNDRIVGCDEA